MYYQFDTQNLTRARAALLLYAMYRSREKSSSLNGVDTWQRFTAYIRGACLKSRTTAEFVQEFCRKAGVLAIKPRYLDTGDPVQMANGEMVCAEGVHDYRSEIIEDDGLMPVLKREGMYLTLLVRERIQREKLEGEKNED